MERIRATTVIAVKKDNQVAMAADGQVTLGEVVMKHKARKVRRMFEDKILGGFAGSGADAFTLFSRLEAKLETYKGQLTRSVVELCKDWRTDRYLQQLEAMLVVADKDQLYVVSGKGDLVEPDDGVVAIGSGGHYAYAAAKALMAHTELDAASLAREALKIAGEICIYTNQEISVEVIG